MIHNYSYIEEVIRELYINKIRAITSYPMYHHDFALLEIRLKCQIRFKLYYKKSVILFWLPNMTI